MWDKIGLGCALLGWGGKWMNLRMLEEGERHGPSGGNVAIHWVFQRKHPCP